MYHYNSNKFIQDYKYIDVTVYDDSLSAALHNYAVPTDISSIRMAKWWVVHHVMLFINKDLHDKKSRKMKCETTYFEADSYLSVTNSLGKTIDYVRTLLVTIDIETGSVSYVFGQKPYCDIILRHSLVCAAFIVKE